MPRIEHQEIGSTRLIATTFSTVLACSSLLQAETVGAFFSDAHPSKAFDPKAEREFLFIHRLVNDLTKTEIHGRWTDFPYRFEFSDKYSGAHMFSHPAPKRSAKGQDLEDY